MIRRTGPRGPVSAVAGGLVAVALLVGCSGPSDPGPGAGGTSSAATGSGSPGAATGSTPATAQGPLPVYVTGRTGAAGKAGLFREFVAAPPQAAGSVQQRVQAALERSLAGLDNPAYIPVWATKPVTVTAVTVTGTRIDITLSGPGATPATTGPARGVPVSRLRQLGVQQLVWTATAAAGQVVPVRITGHGPLLGALRDATDRSRPGDPVAIAGELAPIWIEAPPGPQPTGTSLRITGYAIAFEATVHWEVVDAAGRVAQSGTVTADRGGPQQGAFVAEVGALAAGRWTFTAYTTSPKDGSRDASLTVPLTVGP